MNNTDRSLLEMRSLALSSVQPKKEELFRDFSLRMEKGELVGLAGYSGSGKTTLALATLGLLPDGLQVSAGRILFLDKDLLALEEAEWRSIRGARIGMVFQEPASAMNPLIRIDKQLCEGMRHHLRLSREEALERATRLLSEVGIQDPGQCLGAYPHQLSGGMRQRVLIAAALSCEPDLLICDEPTSALDVTIQAQLVHLLARVAKNSDLAILFISHDLPLLSGISDRIYDLGRYSVRRIS